ncbi:MAG: MurR/RpiR family transcriptional regulator [Firmicutes bacterium]|nr:MurR/RpiR family transcriptional regulator [Bacillota bacterium]
MLIKDRLENTRFSNSEQGIVDYILEKRMDIRDMTTKQIAEVTYTSPSLLVRIAKKMGYSGWKELQNAFVKECMYLDSHQSNVDANLPFDKKDTILGIANKLAELKKETIDETLALISLDEIKKAVSFINNSRLVYVFSFSNNYIVSQEFQHQMLRIGKQVITNALTNETRFYAYGAGKDSCAIVISYSGETSELVAAAKILHENHIPLIAITNIGDNTLSHYADCILRMSTQEKLYSKIGNYTINESVSYILEILYSSLFVLDYEENYNYRRETSKTIEVDRFSTVHILQEDNNKK